MTPDINSGNYLTGLRVAVMEAAEKKALSATKDFIEQVLEEILL